MEVDPELPIALLDQKQVRVRRGGGGDLSDHKKLGVLLRRLLKNKIRWVGGDGGYWEDERGEEKAESSGLHTKEMERGKGVEYTWPFPGCQTVCPAS